MSYGDSEVGSVVAMGDDGTVDDEMVDDTEIGAEEVETLLGVKVAIYDVHAL